jgi:hypothetical protein
LSIADFLRRSAPPVWIALQAVVLSGLILVTRCANYQEVFVAGNIYFTDADCYARMIRARMCEKNPGLIIRHHDFENFPTGTIPHTTAPLDYLIVALALTLKPFSAQALDLAGAIISPLLALLGGWFLWWWSQKMRFAFRAAMLLLYAVSPILVHGAKLGRSDHQSVLILLLMIAICAEWRLGMARSTTWSMLSGLAWGASLWISFYEPLILLLVVLTYYAFFHRDQFARSDRRRGWPVLALIVGIAFLVEQRVPRSPMFVFDAQFRAWARLIGELLPVRFNDPVWFQWAGWMLAVAPLLIWFALRNETQFAGKDRRGLALITVLIVSCYALTLWQARWAYFFLLLFAIATPSLLASVKPPAVGWAMFMVSIFPVLQDWDRRLWPNESASIARFEARSEAVELRALANQIRSETKHAFLAPWWLSPSIAYWSGQPAMAGSSHESLPGTLESARFFLSHEALQARELLQRHRIEWVFAYDASRVLENSNAIVNKNKKITAAPLGLLLDRTPSQSPPYLRLVAQGGTAKLYRVNHSP